MEYLSPKLDIVFKKMFGDINNSDMLRSLVGAYLGIDTNGKFELSNTEITPEEIERKFARLDLRISTEKSEVDVEVQVLNTLDYNDRCLYYWASLYTSSVPRGGEYKEAKQTMSLNILDFKMFNCKNFNTNFMFCDPNNHVVLSDKARISFIELPKIRNITPEQIRNDERLAWAAFFNAKKEEDFDMLNETTKNTAVQKAVTVIRQLSADERICEEARKREDALFNERSALSAHYKKGVAEGIAIGETKEREKLTREYEDKQQRMIQAFRSMGVSEEAIAEAVKLSQSDQDDDPSTGDAVRGSSPRPQSLLNSSPKHGKK